MFSVPSHCMSPGRRVLFECTPFYYPFGNTEARDVFKEWSAKPKESGDFVKMLFLGCGDLRHALTTATGERGSSCLEIHLNDNNPSIIARNVLMLSIITNENFNLEGDEDLKFLWDVWYNALWSASTSAKFIEETKSLVGGTLPNNVNIPRCADREILKQVWQRWLSMFDSQCSMKIGFLKEVTESRKNFIIRGWIKASANNEPFDPSDTKFFREATDGLAVNVEHFLYEGIQPDKETKRKIRQELIYYFEHGYCFVGKQNSRTRNTSVNPTLLDPITKKWYVQYQLNPFEGFFNLFKQNISQMDAGKYRREQAILFKNSQAILRKKIESYRKDCRNNTVKFTFHLSDAVEFCLSGSPGTFDVIDCSNLSDNVGLANILVAARGRLSDHPDAIVITQAMKWSTLSETVAQYVQDALGTPLSMIPTVYGLKLASTVELGAKTSRVLPLPASLIWRRCPEYRNVTFTHSEASKKCFDDLLATCLDTNFLLENCGMASYTLLTFHLAACGLIQRFKLTPNEVSPTQLLTSPDVLDGQYRLQLRTLDFWAKGRRLSRFTSIMNGHLQILPSGSDAFQSTQSNFFNRSTPFLQLLLVPKDYAPTADALAKRGNLITDFTPDVYVIDIFTFRFVRKEDDPECLESVNASFILPEETTVELTHVALIVDVHKVLKFKTPMFYLGDIKSLIKESFSQPYPITLNSESNDAVADCEIKPNLAKCIETSDKYVVQLEASKEEASSVSFDSNQELPCESAHLLNVSVKYSVQRSRTTMARIRRLTFQFSHAFMAEQVTSAFDATDGSLKVILPKAIYEPWPFQFQGAKRIDVNCLKRWSETKPSPCPLLSMHLGTQFVLAELQAIASSSEPVLKATPLSEVRQMIRTIFSSSFQNSTENFAIKAGWTEREPDWYLKAHLPIRTGPNGEPFLVITAVDHQKAQQMVDRGQIDADKAFKDFTRIMNPCKEVLWIPMPTPDGARLFRYLMRLNSAKVHPNAWQKGNLPGGKKKCGSLVMFPTYLSPLYGDGETQAVRRDYPGDVLRKLLSNESTRAQAKPVCFTCGKQSGDLKKCSRCKTVSYCGTDCQRTDWPRHKADCKALT